MLFGPKETQIKITKFSSQASSRCGNAWLVASRYDVACTAYDSHIRASQFFKQGTHHPIPARLVKHKRLDRLLSDSTDRVLADSATGESRSRFLLTRHWPFQFGLAVIELYRPYWRRLFFLPVG